MTDQAKHYSLRPHEGKALFVLGDVVTLKLSTAETNSAYSLIEIMSVPGSGPAFLHTHGPQETFWILEGDHEIYGGMEMGRNMRSLRPPTMGKACHVGIGSRHACFLQRDWCADITRKLR